MEAFVLLVLLAMFGVAFLAGLAPRFVMEYPKAMNLVAVLGAGFLLGVSILIVLPESVAALIES
jgi:hypothetical protein